VGVPSRRAPHTCFERSHDVTPLAPPVCPPAPCSIFLDGGGNVKLGDFGLAKELPSGSKLAYTSLGTVSAVL
jgi:serine/threonine protein kinase